MTPIVAAMLFAQGGAYFKANFPNPTGANGYEEYMAAADMFLGPAIEKVFEEYHRDKKLSDARSLVIRFAAVLRLARAGNAKNRIPPWTSANFSERGRHPLIELLYVADVLVANSRVRFADGHPDSAVDALFDLFRFSKRGEEFSIEALTGAHYEHGLAYEQLATGFHQLSLNGCKRLRQYFESAAAEFPAVVTAARADLPEIIADVPKVFDRLLEYEGWVDMPAGIKTLSPEQREFYVGRIRTGLQEFQEQIDEMFAKDESQWLDHRYADNDPIVEFAVNYLKSFTMWDFALTSRTRLRLAALHCRVIEYKRRFNRLPIWITQFAPPESIRDPANGGPFVYEKLSEQSYRLYSNGNEHSGPIDLQWGRIS
jgi:hypothetical protein